MPWTMFYSKHFQEGLLLYVSLLKYFNIVNNVYLCRVLRFYGMCLNYFAGRRSENLI